MNWFEGHATVEHIKERFRDLAKQHHPDLGGDTATMQDINAAYLEALKSCDGQINYDNAGKEHAYHYQEAREREIMDKLTELLKVVPAGVHVSLIGLWLWITNTTREDIATRTALKAAGCWWHVTRHCWYWRAAEMRHYGRRSRGSLADLANRYGCREFESRGETSIAAA